MKFEAQRAFTLLEVSASLLVLSLSVAGAIISIQAALREFGVLEQANRRQINSADVRHLLTDSLTHTPLEQPLNGRIFKLVVPGRGSEFVYRCSTVALASIAALSYRYAQCERDEPASREPAGEPTVPQNLTLWFDTE